MKPIIYVALGFVAFWAVKSKRMQNVTNRILPQNQRGISTFPKGTTAHRPSQVYASMVTPPGASRQGGYVPGFGPFVDSVDPSSLYFNQA